MTTRYMCPYTCDGVPYVVGIDASSAAEAAARMNELPWGPNSGPSGRPYREDRQPDARLSVAMLSSIVVLAVVSGLSYHHLRHEFYKFEAAVHLIAPAGHFASPAAAARLQKETS